MRAGFEHCVRTDHRARAHVGVPADRAVLDDDWWVRLNATSANLPTYQRVNNASQDFLYAARSVPGKIVTSGASRTVESM